MKLLNYTSKNFYNDLDKLIEQRNENDTAGVDLIVKKINNEIKERGDKVLFKYISKYDGLIVNKKNILLSKKIRNSYKDKIDINLIKSFRKSIQNVTKYHKKQLPSNYHISDEGVKTGSKWNPIDSVGLYVPGGKSFYPSSLIMSAVPAKVAGVKRIVVATPTPKIGHNPYILALLDELKIDEVYQMGGAQAVSALAHGTKSIKSVNKIFGPGNVFVNSAKKQVFGKVGIDFFAGPSEIIVVADSFSNPEWVACDLMAQAEHDERAQVILITDSKKLYNDVLLSIKKLIEKLPKKRIIKKSFNTYGLIIFLKNIAKSAEIINYIAPEHLHLQNKNYKKILKNIRNAGSIFLGKYSTEAFGDYIVGTNHILPTAGTAKFSSGLNVLDFMKRSSTIEINLKGFKKYANSVSNMSKVEKLDAHGLSVKIRQTEKK